MVLWMTVPQRAIRLPRENTKFLISLKEKDKNVKDLNPFIVHCLTLNQAHKLIGWSSTPQILIQDNRKLFNV